MMNALKFLAVDRSLDSGKDMVGRFQVREAGMLPVLNGGRSVDADSKSAASAKRSKTNRSMWRRFFGWVGLTNAGRAVPATEAVESQPELESVQKSAVQESENVAAQGAVVTEGTNRFARFAGYNPFNRTEKRDVQIEFRFENVRVVCNELHDTDFIIKT